MSAEVSFAEVSKHTTAKDAWMVIDGNVYDVTKFLDDHPGGEEVLLEQAGQDASEAFEEIGHSDDARNLLKNMLVGPVSGAPKVVKKEEVETKKVSSTPPPNNNGVLLALVPVVAIISFLVYQQFS